MLGDRDLWQRDDEVGRQCSAGTLGQVGERNVERTGGPPEALRREGLDADADEWRQATRSHPRGELLGDGGGVAIFLGVGAAAVAIFEVDPHIFDRLTAQLLAHSGEDRPGQPGRRLGGARGIFVPRKCGVQRRGTSWINRQIGGAGQAQSARKRYKVGRILVKAGEGQCPQARGAPGLEELRAAVDGVYWPAPGRVAWVALI